MAVSPPKPYCHTYKRQIYGSACGLPHICLLFWGFQMSPCIPWLSDLLFWHLDALWIEFMVIRSRWFCIRSVFRNKPQQTCPNCNSIRIDFIETIHGTVFFYMAAPSAKIRPPEFFFLFWKSHREMWLALWAVIQYFAKLSHSDPWIDTWQYFANYDYFLNC